MLLGRQINSGVCFKWYGVSFLLLSGQCYASVKDAIIGKIIPHGSLSANYKKMLNQCPHVCTHFLIHISIHTHAHWVIWPFEHGWEFIPLLLKQQRKKCHVSAASLNETEGGKSHFLSLSQNLFCVFDSDTPTCQIGAAVHTSLMWCQMWTDADKTDGWGKRRYIWLYGRSPVSVLLFVHTPFQMIISSIKVYL